MIGTKAAAIGAVLAFSVSAVSSADTPRPEIACGDLENIDVAFGGLLKAGGYETNIMGTSLWPCLSEIQHQIWYRLLDNEFRLGEPARREFIAAYELHCPAIQPSTSYSPFNLLAQKSPAADARAVAESAHVCTAGMLPMMTGDDFTMFDYVRYVSDRLTILARAAQASGAQPVLARAPN